jgi:hypothetical protein
MNEGTDLCIYRFIWTTQHQGMQSVSFTSDVSITIKRSGNNKKKKSPCVCVWHPLHAPIACHGWCTSPCRLCTNRRILSRLHTHSSIISPHGVASNPQQEAFYGNDCPQHAHYVSPHHIPTDRPQSVVGKVKCNGSKVRSHANAPSAMQLR